MFIFLAILYKIIIIRVPLNDPKVQRRRQARKTFIVLCGKICPFLSLKGILYCYIGQ